ncbi:DUF2213 domain-containing protein [Pseudomonas benzopyrenica]|uniref:DUF2213 domain-containing protein n=1 Tax=Pseudomonas benzopyrenica TaxID=2993566 RepID=A0ABZ2FYC4_9PSED
MLLHDSVSVSAVRRTTDGYLVAEARVARTGIQDYLGTEVGKPEMPIVRLYRPPEAVFAEDAMRSYAYRPMTNGHHGDVNAANWKQLAVGQTGAEVLRDGEFVRVPMVVMDAAAIQDVEDGRRELSMGLEAIVVFEDGLTPEGEPYDARVESMRMNHLALVDRARGGEQLRIGDQRSPGPNTPAHPTHNGGHPMADSMRTVLVDGLSVLTTDQGAQAIEKLTKQLADAGFNVKTLTDAHTAAIAGKDRELAGKDNEIEKLKGQLLTDAQIDARVLARGDLIGKAKSIADADYSGKSDDEIRKAAVVAKLGDAAVAGKSADYITARFDILVEDSSDPVRTHLKAQDGQIQNPNDNGQAAYETRLTDAWKGGAQ